MAGCRFAFIREVLARYRVSGAHLSSAKRTVRFAPVLRHRYFGERSLAACPDWLVRWLLSSNLRQLRFGEAWRLVSEICATQGILGAAKRIVRCYMEGAGQVTQEQSARCNGCRDSAPSMSLTRPFATSRDASTTTESSDRSAAECPQNTDDCP
jgi:hypothetical protein